MNPEEMQEQQPPLTLDQLIQAYMQQALTTQSDNMLNQEVKSKIMLNMAQALNLLVPLGQNDGQAELQMKAQEHQMTLQAKQAELEMKKQEHAMKMEHSQAENEMKLSQQQENHQINAILQAEKHQAGLEMAKQKAAQSQNKPDSTV